MEIYKDDILPYDVETKKDGSYVDPTSIKITTKVNGATKDNAQDMTKDSTGKYHYDITFDTAGEWHIYIEMTDSSSRAQTFHDKVYVSESR